MFGLFKKTPDPKFVALFHQRCTEATGFIAGALVDGRLKYADLEIDLDAPEARKNLWDAFLLHRAQLSLNPEHWPSDLQRLNAEQKNMPSKGNEFHIAAFLLLAGILQMNTICKGALAYPKESGFTKAAFTVLALNGPALEQIFDEEWRNRHPIEPAFLLELRAEFPAIDKLMDKAIGWNE